MARVVAARRRPRQKMRWQAVCKWPYSGSSRMPVLGGEAAPRSTKTRRRAPTRERVGNDVKTQIHRTGGVRTGEETARRCAPQHRRRRLDRTTRQPAVALLLRVLAAGTKKGGRDAACRLRGFGGGASRCSCLRVAACLGLGRTAEQISCAVLCGRVAGGRSVWYEGEVAMMEWKPLRMDEKEKVGSAEFCRLAQTKQGPDRGPQCRQSTVTVDSCRQKCCGLMLAGPGSLNDCDRAAGWLPH
jgi:hypothetical protein